MALILPYGKPAHVLYDFNLKRAGSAGEVALFVARAPRWHRLCAMITRLELVAAPEFESMF